MRKQFGDSHLLSRMVCSAVLAAVFFNGSLAAQETCEGAADIGIETVQGSTQGAPRGGESDCGRSDNSPSHWYRYTAAADASVTVSTCGSDYDTVLSVYSGCPAAEDNELGCNDDTCDLQSEVEFSVTEGQAYLVRVAGYRGRTGGYTLEVSADGAGPGPGPGPGNCEDAAELTLDNRVEGSTAGRESTGSASCGSSSQSPDTIFRYVADAPCLLVASTCSSGYDTVLSIHSECPPTNANQLACNDDACDLQSTIAYEVEAGTTYFIRIAGYNGASGDYSLELSCSDPPVEGEGADITISSMSGIRQMGRLGDVVALSMQSTICNIGSDAVDWYSNPDPRHPFLVFNLYRMQGGRLDQIGQSWAKHGFAASQTSGVCGPPCRVDGDGNLGAGCADIYGVSTNASQRTFGPRHEINPWTGAFSYAGSHIDTTSSNHNPVQHRLAVSDDDLDPEANPGARYIVELYTLSHDDSEHTNSLGWQEVDISGQPGGTWDLDFRQVMGNQGSALDAWEGGERTVIPEAELIDDGRCYLDLHVSDNGDGTYRYEYALYNLDMNRSVSSITIPVGEDVAVTSLGFKAVQSADDGFNNDPWEAARDGSAVTWSTSPVAEHPNSNPLGWGNLYNFWFDADAAPAEGSVTLGVYRTDLEGPSSFAGLSRVPGGGGAPPPPGGTIFRRGDTDGNGTVELTDAVFILGYLFQGSTTPACLETADSDDNGKVDVSDAIRLLGWLFAGGGPLAPPGSEECGRDPTPGDEGECDYDANSC